MKKQENVNKSNKEENDEKVQKVKNTIPISRAAALGFAVLFATSTTLTGCAKKPQPVDLNGDGVISQEEIAAAQEKEDDDYYYGGGSHGSYYRYSGAYDKKYQTGHGKSFWSSFSNSGSGYSGIRGGSGG